RRRSPARGRGSAARSPPPRPRLRCSRRPCGPLVVRGREWHGPAAGRNGGGAPAFAAASAALSLSSRPESRDLAWLTLSRAFKSRTVLREDPAPGAPAGVTRKGRMRIALVFRHGSGLVPSIQVGPAPPLRWTP